MNYFTEAPREFARKVVRQWSRFCTGRLERRLVEAETQLGLLGWQQADYDQDTQRQVQEIYNVERQQSELTNEAAALGLEMRRLEEVRAAAFKQFEEERKRLDAEMRKLNEPLEAMEKQLAEKRGNEPNFVRGIPELDRELREVQKAYSELLPKSPQTPAMREALVHMRERIVAIPNEKTDLRTQHLRTVSDIKNLEEAIERHTPGVLSLKEQLQALDSDWKRKERDVIEQIRRLTAARQEAESRGDSLEGAKSNPYQRIGQVLANSGIGPLNQPQALETVKQLRFQISEQQQIVLESERDTAAEDAGALRMSTRLWAGVCAALILFAALVLHAR